MSSAGLEYLLGRAALVEARVRALVAARRAVDPAPDDPFRGLYLSDEAVDRLMTPPTLPAVTADGDPDSLRALDQRAAEAESSGHPVPLLRLAADAGLTELDVELLVVALLPDLDSRFEGLYGYLNDDVTRRRATVGLAFELVGEHSADARARGRLNTGAPLLRRRLVVIDEPDRPFLTRNLRVPDRVAAHLLGDDEPDPSLLPALTDVTPYDHSLAELIAAAVADASSPVYVRDSGARVGASIAAAALRRNGLGTIGVDLARAAAEGIVDEVIASAGREALLQRAGIVAEPVEALTDAHPAALRRLAALDAPVVLVGHSTWDPAWSHAIPVILDAPAMTPDERAHVWLEQLEGVDADLDPAHATAHFILGPTQTTRAVQAARAAARLSGVEVTAEHLRRGARAQNAAGLERLARRVEPSVSWDSLVLPPTVFSQLRDLSSRALHRDLVLTEWRMRPGGGRGKGLTALFAGDSGTGKTMSAEVIADDLGLDMYSVNLATVVDKYVGETEKNLERIFTEASGVNAVLLFDEADAIFGKRSEVRDAHDRYANIETAYLLQRMESFDGLAILSTNLRANIDDAFTRRLDAIIDFPTPDERLRLELWRRSLAPPLPVADDLDLEFCARSFELSGGNIRSIAITAAYFAAAKDAPVAMTDIMAATEQEYRKLGRLVLEREFGQYFDALRQAAARP